MIQSNVHQGPSQNMLMAKCQPATLTTEGDQLCISFIRPTQQEEDDYSHYTYQQQKEEGRNQNHLDLHTISLPSKGRWSESLCV